MTIATAWIPALLLAVSAAAHADAPARCVVRGNDVSVAHVSVNGFTVGIAHVKASATVSTAGTTVDVDGVVAFRATVPRLWYTVRTESVVGGGLVTMFPGAHLIGTHLDGAAIAGAAVLYAMDVLEGEDKPADETASTVSVPCEHLTLDWSRDPATPPTSAGTGWQSRGAALTFRAAPRANAPAVTYAATSCEDDCLSVLGGAAKNGYRKVAVVNERVAVTGWVKASELVRIPDDVLVGHSYGCMGDHEAPGASFGFSGSRAPESVATLARGTKIYDAPTGATWATVTADAEFDVRYEVGESWAEVVRIPGIQDLAGHAYVPVSALVKPRARVSDTTR